MHQQVTILGRLGNAPELRYTPSGKAVASFSVATSRTWTGQDGQRQEKTVWWRVSAWGKTGEICAEHLDKGRQVLIVGELEEPNVWTDKQGNSRASLELTARDVRFIGGRQDAPSSNGNGQPVAAGAPVADEDIPF